MKIYRKSDIEICESCNNLDSIKENGKVITYICMLHLEETTLNDNCSCWEVAE